MALATVAKVLPTTGYSAKPMKMLLPKRLLVTTNDCGHSSQSASHRLFWPQGPKAPLPSTALATAAKVPPTSDFGHGGQKCLPLVTLARHSTINALSKQQKKNTEEEVHLSGTANSRGFFILNEEVHLSGSANRTIFLIACCFTTHLPTCGLGGAKNYGSQFPRQLFPAG